MKRNFTLIELLVTIAILAILAAMLLPALSQARERGKMAKCMGNVKSAAQGIAMYGDDSNDWMLECRWVRNGQPVFWPERLIWYMYPGLNGINVTKDNLPKAFHCPSQVLNAGTNINYGYSQYLGYNSTVYDPARRRNLIKRPSQIIMYADGDAVGDYNCIIAHSWYMVGNHHLGGSPIGYVDGHAEWKKRSEVSRPGALPNDNSGRGPSSEIDKIWGEGNYIYQ